MASKEESYRGVFDGKIGLGASPALVVVDFLRAYTTEGAPLFAPDVRNAVRHTVDLLRVVREKRWPVIFTRVLYNENGLDGGLFVQKVPLLRTMVRGNPLAEIVSELEVRREDTVLVKQYPSAFFGTTLAPMLTALGVDTLLLTGCSTSGCIRATAVDGMQHGFRVTVPRECVGDRHPEPHASNLFDIHTKYGDVVDLDALKPMLAELPARRGAPV